MKQIQYILFLITALVAVSCTDEYALSKSSRFVSLSVSMPGGETTTRVGVSLAEGSKDLSVSFSADDKFSIYVRQGDVIQQVEDVTFAVNGENGKQGTLAFEMPASVNMSNTYTMYGVCGASSRIKDGRLIVDDNSKIDPSFEFQAPVWFEFTGQGTPSTIQCQYIGTFIVIHVDNQSDTDNLFQIWGVISDALYDALYWDEKNKQFSEDFGVSPTSNALSVAAGKKAVFIYNGIPNGKAMETLNVSMHIGKEITWGMGIEIPQTPKTVGKTLQQGRAYHVYLTWDGKELKFGDGEEDVPVIEVETFTVNGVSFDMVKVEGGTFMMGASDDDDKASNSEKPLHKVTLDSYYIGKTEVTQALLNAVYDKSYQTTDDNAQKPVVWMTWMDAQSFVHRLGILTGLRFRLPTEAEWEFAARGGLYSKGYLYSGSNSIDEVGWYSDNSEGKAHDVALLSPNELGIFDMSGNVEEWCQDYGGPYSIETQINPVGFYGYYDSKYIRHDPIRRGGSFDPQGGSQYCRNTKRAWGFISASTYTGLRVVLSPDNDNTNVMELANKMEDDMVFVEGGSFNMRFCPAINKNEEIPGTLQEVGSFYICKYEVTQKLWNAVMGSSTSYFRNNEGNLPVDYVSWDMCQDFIDKLNRITGKKFRLPTEAEWEFAARGGKFSKGYYYSGSNNFKECAWFQGTPNHNLQTHPVGQMIPNELGLYDMSGNAKEWTKDEDDNGYGIEHISKGGDWSNEGQYQSSCIGGWSYRNAGLRLVKDL